MLGTPTTEAFEERVKTLVRAAWKAEKTDDEILAELERAIRDPATPVDSLTSSLRRLRTQPSRFCLVPCPWFHGSEPSPSFTRTTTATHSFNGVPSFFRCACQEACTGGTHGYKWAGWALAQNVHRLIPDGITGDEWREQLDDIETLLREERHEEVATWLADCFPRCLALVPIRRRAAFFEGFRKALVETWGIE